MKMNSTSKRNVTKSFISLFVVLLLTLGLLSGCATRDPDVTPASPKTSMEEEGENKEPESDAIDDKVPADKDQQEEKAKKAADLSQEQQEQAEQITATLLERAVVCDQIYRGALPKDENMPPTSFGGEEEYVLVLDGELTSPESIKAYWSNTFTGESTSAKLYDSISERKIYLSANQELYSITPAFEEPLTMGEWDIHTVKVLGFSDSTLEVSMNARLVGEDAGENTLTMVQKNGTWLLTDSYFLD